MEDIKGATTMTWEELEDCGVSIEELHMFRNLFFLYHRPT